MRYILDSDGYIQEYSFEHTIICDGNTCTEYTGTNPEGYDSLEAWAIGEDGKINAWKIVDNNLVYDAAKYQSLQEKYDLDSEANRLVSYKEINKIINTTYKDNADNYLRSTSSSSKVVEVTDSNKFASTYIKLVANEDITGILTIKFNNGNLLTNEATTETISGVTFTQNNDRSITINGTSTAATEFNVAGTSTNIKPILVIKKDLDYYLSGLNDITLKMYNYDGTDRTEVYSGTGGAISFTDSDKPITQIVLSIASGTTILSKKVKPMLNPGTQANDYVAYEGNEVSVNLEDYTLNTGDNIKINDGSPILQNEIYIGNTMIIGNDLIIGGELSKLDSCIMPLTYLDKTYMYTYKDTNIIAEYPNTTRNNDLTGYQTPNGAFGIDEYGNMECSGATITGGTIELYGNGDNANFKVYGDKQYTYMWPYGLSVMQKYDLGDFEIASFGGNTSDLNGANSGYLQMRGDDPATNIYLTTELNSDGSPFINVCKDGLSRTNITGVGIWSPSFNNTSLESTKKNFKPFTNALDIINDTDIYKYNLKSQEDSDKEHIGLVIGDKYKYSKEITNNSNDAVDLYSMVSVCFQAIKEQQSQIEILQNKIKEMESGK